MRKAIFTMILFLMLGFGNATAIADRHAPHKSRPPKHNKHHYGKRNKHPCTNWRRDKSLREMVNRAAYGGDDIIVYPLGNNTYIVYYNDGGRYYSRQVNTLLNTITGPKRVVIGNPNDQVPGIQINIPF